jgi:hypothetical protein
MRRQTIAAALLVTATLPDAVRRQGDEPGRPVLTQACRFGRVESSIIQPVRGASVPPGIPRELGITQGLVGLIQTVRNQRSDIRVPHAAISMPSARTFRANPDSDDGPRSKASSLTTTTEIMHRASRLNSQARSRTRWRAARLACRNSTIEVRPGICLVPDTRATGVHPNDCNVRTKPLQELLRHLMNVLHRHAAFSTRLSEHTYRFSPQRSNLL